VKTDGRRAERIGWQRNDVARPFQGRENAGLPGRAPFRISIADQHVTRLRWTGTLRGDDSARPTSDRREYHGLRAILKSYVAYYTNSRTHLSLEKDSPSSRPISPHAHEPIIAIPQVGGLHHRYERRAA